MTNNDVPHPQASTRGAVGASDIALVSTFAALIAVCAILPAITIGGLVPITLQTFAVLLAGGVLGARRGFLAVLLYIGVGLVGLPVFAGGAAGLAPFAGPTVGYLVAMPLAAAATGFMVQRLPRRSALLDTVTISLAAIIASVAVMYPLGIGGLAWRAGMGLGEAFIFNVVFVPGDLIKAVLAGVIAASVHRAFPDLVTRPARRARA